MQRGKFHRVVDAEVEAEPAERVVDVCGVAGEEHAAVPEACRHALVHAVEIAVHDIVTAGLGEEGLQSRSVASGSNNSASVCSSRVVDSTRHRPRPSSPETLNSAHQSSGSEK